MGLFIELRIDQSRFVGREARHICARVCPVDALKATDEALEVVAENEDECIFCYLCEQNAPEGGIKVVKAYEEWLKVE